MHAFHKIRVHLHEKLLERIPLFLSGKVDLYCILKGHCLGSPYRPLLAHTLKVSFHRIEKIVLLLHGQHYRQQVPPALLHLQTAVAACNLMAFIPAVKHEIHNGSPHDHHKQNPYEIKPHLLGALVLTRHSQRHLAHIGHPQHLGLLHMGYIGIGVFYVAFFIKQGAVDFSLLFHSGGIGLHNHTLIPVIVDMVAIKHRQPAVEHSRIILTFLIIMAAEKHLIQPLQPTGCVITFNTAISFQQPFNILGISIQVAHNQIAYRTVMLYIRHGEQGKQHLMPFLRVPLAEMDIGYVDSVSGNSFFKPHS